MAEHPMELRADFQQFYGLNIDMAGRAYSISHAAALAAMLPPESRTARAIEPSLEWGWQEQLLARIEYWTHAAAYAGTKDAQHGRNRPRPIERPSAKSRAQRRDVDPVEIMRRLTLPRREVGGGD